MPTNRTGTPKIELNHEVIDGQDRYFFYLESPNTDKEFSKNIRRNSEDEIVRLFLCPYETRCKSTITIGATLIADIDKPMIESGWRRDKISRRWVCPKCLDIREVECH